MTTEVLLDIIEKSLSELGYAELEPRALFEPIGYTLSLGGKRVRPLLCLLACRLYSDNIATALPIARALEVFHNFTLLHDDLMDKSPIRRGQPTVYRKWNDNTAILSGDAMSIEAYRSLEGIENPQLLFKVLPFFNKMAIEICKGQQYDMDFEEREHVSVAEYIEMIRLKTAVLLGAALRLGALAAGAYDSDAQILDEVGQALGLAFQIQDDYLDVYGDEKTFGKPIGGDIMNGKKTLMLLYTQAKLERDDRAELDRLMQLGQEHKEERISGVRRLYDKAGTPIYAQHEIERLTQEALTKLRGLGLKQERLEPLYQLFDKLTTRKN
ncbi:MAG: polyprenyl synthetase family protein [Porphyromonas sp.]|nr:MAG: polyprenyl synthetase family protein [Porphyromonas sp.]